MPLRQRLPERNRPLFMEQIRVTLKVSTNTVFPFTVSEFLQNLFAIKYPKHAETIPFLNLKIVANSNGSCRNFSIFA